MREVVVVGAGPAGVSSAIYLKRHGVDVELIEKDEVGGLALNAHCIEDYPGLLAGKSGREFGADLEGQLARQGVAVTSDEVPHITKDQNGFALHGLRKRYESKCVILATGTSPKRVDARLVGDLSDRLSYEVKGVPEGYGSVVVIGAGEAALDYALSLERLGYDVAVLCRSGEPRSNRDLLEKVQLSNRVRILNNVCIDEIVAGEDHLMVTCRDRESIDCAFAVCAIGREANLPSIGAGTIKRLEVRADGRTNVLGLFVAGDARRGRERHIATAVGDGVQAAVMAAECLEGLRCSK